MSPNSTRRSLEEMPSLEMSNIQAAWPPCGYYTFRGHDNHGQIVFHTSLSNLTSNRMSMMGELGLIILLQETAAYLFL